MDFRHLGRVTWNGAPHSSRMDAAYGRPQVGRSRDALAGMADYDLCGLRRVDLFPCSRPQPRRNNTKAVRLVSRWWRRTFPSMVSPGDCCAILDSLAQFSPLVRRIMATLACPG